MEKKQRNKKKEMRQRECRLYCS